MDSIIRILTASMSASVSWPKSYWLKPELLADTVFSPERSVAVPKLGEEEMDPEMRANYLYSSAKAAMAFLSGEITGGTIKVIGGFHADGEGGKGGGAPAAAIQTSACG